MSHIYPLNNPLGVSNWKVFISPICHDPLPLCDPTCWRGPSCYITSSLQRLCTDGLSSMFPCRQEPLSKNTWTPRYLDTSVSCLLSIVYLHFCFLSQESAEVELTCSTVVTSDTCRSTSQWRHLGGLSNILDLSSISNSFLQAQPEPRGHLGERPYNRADLAVHS